MGLILNCSITCKHAENAVLLCAVLLRNTWGKIEVNEATTGFLWSYSSWYRENWEKQHTWNLRYVEPQIHRHRCPLHQYHTQACRRNPILLRDCILCNKREMRWTMLPLSLLDPLLRRENREKQHTWNLRYVDIAVHCTSITHKHAEEIRFCCVTVYCAINGRWGEQCCH